MSGTHTSVARSFVPGKRAASACVTSCLAFQRRARASASRSWTISVAPSSRAIACTSSRSARTSSSLPEASTNRHGASGYAVPEKALTATTHHASSSSIRETPPPAATMPAAVRPALSTSGNETRIATTCSWIAWSRTVTSVITASVPSEPTSRPVRS